MKILCSCARVQRPVSLLAALLFLPSVALAEPATISRVIDGDSVRVILAGQSVVVRVAGIDSAELQHAKCIRERQLGEAARAEAARLLPVGASVEVIRTAGRDKFGRVLARIEIQGKDFGQEMLRLGLASYYNGRGPKREWCK